MRVPKRHIGSIYLVPLLAAFLICGAGQGAIAADIDADRVIRNIRLYASPGAAPTDAVDVAIRDGRIIAIGSGLSSAGAEELDAGGRAATAGLWNSHVHFMHPDLRVDVQAHLDALALRYGFTSVVDTGSDLAATRKMSARVAAGELRGPRILMAGGTFVFTDGTPTYLPGLRLPEVARPEDADPMVAAVMDAGANGIKLFSGSYISPTETIHLPPSVIRAIADATHRRGGFVVSHPTDRVGLENAVGNGVDILAHTAPPAGPLGDELIADMRNRNVALIPTLKLWSYELVKGGAPEAAIRTVQSLAIAQLAEYHAAGGEVLFGTDTGYMTDLDPTLEYVLMQEAGMDFAALLSALTVRPAQRFAGESGKVEVGAPADIVLYAADPARDVRAFANVWLTVRGGRTVWCQDAAACSPN